ncbi:Chemotaxis protein methyltransferase CheR [Minicystis rosea]|nr:Chemotaxis protein methyltransferase CheR [Minicystis rosea]
MAVGVTVLALVARVLLAQAWGATSPFPELALAVTIATAVGGLGPGLLATAASALAGGWMSFELAVEYLQDDRADLVVFVVVGVCISLIGEHAHRARARNRAAEETLRESEARFRRAIMAVPFPAMICADDGQIVDVNRAWLELSGYTPADIPTLAVWLEKAHDEPERSRACAVIKRLLTIEHQVEEGEYAVRTASGGRRAWRIGGAALGRDGLGRRLAVAVAADLTTQRRAEEALRESLARLAASSEERLCFALANAQAGCWDWDARPDRRAWPEGPHRLHDIDGSAVDLSFDAWIDNIHPDDRAQVMATARRLFAQRAEDYSVEHRIVHMVHPTLGVRWIHARGRITYSDEGAPIRAVGIIRDVTEQKRLEHERELLLDSERAARAEAERATRMKDEFLAMISHELRTPLNAILGFAQLLRRPDAAPLQREHCLDIIERNTRLQAQLISDLLDVSRITTGKLYLDLQPMDLPLVVEAAIDACRAASEAKQVALDATIDPARLRLEGDPGRMQQVVTNLITNAVKFTPKGGRVTVSLARQGGRVVIAVRDTGQGIAPEFLPRIFERFSQADASMARRHGGLGLGLSIVEHLVGLHGGEVRAESDGLGLGATFTITLPCEVRPSGERSAPAPHLGDESDLYGMRVLVVDDEADARDLVRRVLEEHGAAVVTAASGPAAIDALGGAAPDVLVSDLGMPGMDGYALIRAVRAGGCGAPAVAVTAFARQEDRLRALSAGYQAHLAKPIEPRDLVMAVASLRQAAA